MSRSRIFVVVSAVAVMSMFVVCGGDDNPGGGDTPNIASFSGTWNASGGRVIDFTGNAFSYKVNDETKYSGTFSVSGSTITFNESRLGTASGNFQLSGETLVLSGHSWDSSVNGTYTKSSGNTGNTDLLTGTKWGGSTDTITFLAGGQAEYRRRGLSDIAQGTYTISGNDVTIHYQGHASQLGISYDEFWVYRLDGDDLITVSATGNPNLSLGNANVGYRMTRQY